MAALALAASLLAGAAPAGAQQQDDTIDGAEVVQMLAGSGSGSPGVDLADVTIEGPVDISGLQAIDRPIRCLRCTFTGAVSLADVRFGGVVELVDAVFEQPVDARGVVFERAAVFDGASFEGRFDASTSRFESVTSFARVDFLNGVSFQRTSFGDRAVFTGTSRDDVDDRLGACQARSGSSVGAARFSGATFNGPAQFRERCFAGVADFAGVRFAGDAEFSVTNFAGAVSFERATFDADASFRVADFGGNASFEGASISETLSFDSAVVRKQLRLSALGGPGALALADVDICQSSDSTSEDPPAKPCSSSAEQRLVLTRLAVSLVTIDLDDIDTIGGPNVRIEVLERVEATARASGRTGVANDAKFELLSRQHDKRDQPWRFYDGLFYRDIAGYLVRPTHPLVWFLVLIGIGAVIRTIARSQRLRRPTHPDRRGAQAASTAIAVFSLFVAGVADTLRTAFGVSLKSGSAHAPTSKEDGAGTTFNVSLQGGAVAAAPAADDDAPGPAFTLSLEGGAVTATTSDDDTDEANAADDADGKNGADVASLAMVLLDGLRRVEWLAFKVLIAIFLLGIANANSTVRELIDAVI